MAQETKSKKEIIAVNIAYMQKPESYEEFQAGAFPAVPKMSGYTLRFKEFKQYARTQEGKAFMSVTPDASIYRSRNKTVKALATAASKQLVQSVINHAPVQEIQGTIDRYKKAIILTSFPELKVNGKEGPEVVKPGTDIIINGNTWTFKGFEADGLTPVIARRIKR